MRAPTIRSLVLLTIVGAAAIALFRMRRPADANADPASPPLAWVATAHQLGPVAYRDPAGVISPDGKYDTMDPAHMEKMSRLVQHGRYLFSPNGSHLAMYDDQKTYFAGLVEFIQDVNEKRF